MSAIKEVLSRKLFSQGGLLEPEQGRNLGGIIASSEPLMEAAKFANGGANFQLGAAPQSLYNLESMQGQTATAPFDPLDFYDPVSIKEPAPTVMPPVRNLSTDPSFVSAADLSIPLDDMTDDDLRFVSDSASLTDSNARNPNYINYPYIGRQVQPGEDIMKLLSGTEGLSSLAARERAVRADQRADKQVTKALFPGSDVGPTTDAAPPDGKDAEYNIKQKESFEMFLSGLEKEETTEFDIEALKKKIGEAFDPLEKNPTTEGLLLAELGASIMNKGFKKGVLEGLPKITAYHDAQFKAKQKRKDDITTLALTDFFRKTEADRGLEKEQFKEDIDTNSFVIFGSDNNWNKNYEPLSYTNKSLTNEQAKALTEKGVDLIKASDITASYLLARTTFKNGTTPPLDPKYYKGVQTTPWEIFGDKTVLNYLVGASKGVENWISPNETTALYSGYKSALQDTLNLKQSIDDMNSVNKDNVTGIKGALQAATSSLSGIGLSEEYLQPALDALDAGKLDDRAILIIRQRMFAAKIAPILLGESGKTISDGDRVRVGDAIGLRESADGIRNYGGVELFNVLLDNPKKFDEVIKILNDSLVNRGNDANNILHAEMTRLNISFDQVTKGQEAPVAAVALTAEFDATKG